MRNKIEISAKREFRLDWNSSISQNVDLYEWRILHNELFMSAMENVGVFTTHKELYKQMCNIQWYV